ncbi:MAG: TonB-dependent receptor [Chitinophagaceae bacterium]|nr:TonB-dependent receptor [Chitinophagaceae bacterium]
MLCQSGLAQDPCDFTFSGTVIDAASQQVIPEADVYLAELHLAAATDSQGNFVFTDLCEGVYTVRITYLGYQTDSSKITLSKNVYQYFYLQEDIRQIQEIQVTGHKDEQKEILTLPQTEIKGLALQQTRGNTLGEALKTLPGVYTLQSGPSIFKPVIHGLHSNRVLLLNNGVRQEGQQWGSEHAPEIDPFVATQLSVIKGPASIRYGSDAIGGVILVDPAPLPTRPGIGGEVNLVAASNNRMGVTSGIVQGAFEKKLSGLSWRAQGTYRRAGNSKTPNYYLENTGFQEMNFSGALAYKKENYGAELYYSEFNTKLGIFTGTHAETLPDINAAINRSEPITPSYFSYTIDRPYQQVKHDLFKTHVYLKFNNKSRVDVIFARQQNVRSEYDYIPLSGRLNPELYLSLVTHTLDVSYKYAPIKNISGSIGFNGITQGNVRAYEMLIPNFRNYGGGIFAIEKWSKNKLTLEAGVRYDYRWLRAYTLDNNTAQVITPTFNWQNVTGSLGSQYYLKENLSWLINIGTAWRAPTVNELLSNGVHQSAVAYERGNANLTSERAYNFSTSLKYEGDRMTAELDVYNHYINGYIYLKPALSYIHTSRGAFPLFDYTQVNATLRGADVVFTYRLFDSLSFISKTSLLFAYNNTIHDYLQLVPANRFENTLKYNIGKIGKLDHFYISLTDLYMAKQNRVPANSDYTAPPAGYMLINADLGFAFPLGKQRMNISFSANNIFNIVYRDYMDRFRYFNDEPGRNFTLRVRLPFELFNKKNTNN